MAITRRTAKRHIATAVDVEASRSNSSKRYKAHDEEISSGCTHGYSQTAKQSAGPGRRLLPDIVDELATTDPNGVWLSIPKELDSADVFCDIFYRQLANAVNRAAWWIHSKVDGHKHGPQILAYLGPTDSRYLILVIAAMKVGHTLLLPSSRNAEITQQKLLEASNCTIIMCAKVEKRKVEDMLSFFGHGAKVYTVHSVPEQHEILDPAPVQTYGYNKSFEAERHNAFVVLHTSGSTGDVVPITLPHSYYAYEDLFRMKFAKDQVLTFAPLNSGARCLYTGPLYHAGAILFTLVKSLLLKVTMLLPPPGCPVTAEVVESCLINGRADMLGTAPSVLEELCSSATRRNSLKSLRYIFCGSGPMPKAVGDTIRSIGVSLLHIYGSTETALLPQLPLEDPANDWQYFRFHPACGATFVPVGKNGLFELVIDRLEGATPQPCFEVFPEAKLHHTQDTFSPHPLKPGLWKFEGRIDEIITLTNGEKFCPSAAEEIIAGHPCIANALIVGQGRFQPTLLLSVVGSSVTYKEILEDVWPVVELANLHSPGYAQICKGFVVVTYKPFLKTPKGTIRRHATEELCGSEINKVYEQANFSLQEPYFISDVQSLDSLQTFLCQVISTQIAVDQKFNSDTDIFSYGLDSLNVAALVSFVNASLKRTLGSANGDIRRAKPQIFYQNRSIAGLKAALYSLINTPESTPTDQECWRKDRKVLLERYTGFTSRLPTEPSNTAHLRPASDVVLLTGSTGSLGRHLLHVLLRDPEISQIYCVNRSPNALTLYLDSFPEDSGQINRVAFLNLPCFDTEDLGVTNSSRFAQLFRNVTHIVHSAWPVNLQLPLQLPPGLKSENASFESHISIVRRLIDMAATAPYKPQLTFISSLSSVLRYTDPVSGSIPESIVDGPKAPLEGGYGRSKWLAECMLDRAVKSGMPVARPKIIRLGQISGPTPRSGGDGHIKVSTWPEHEMIPSMIRSSATVRALPESLHAMEKIRWIPVDEAARIIANIAASQTKSQEVKAPGALVYNATNIQSNGREKTWRQDVVPVVQPRLERAIGGSIEIVPMQEWLCRVEKQAITEAGSRCEALNPAVRLISIYEELAGSNMHSGLGNAIETGMTHEASHAFRDLQPVSATWMEEWMGGWGL